LYLDLVGLERQLKMVNVFVVIAVKNRPDLPRSGFHVPVGALLAKSC
jgi:hypothetical protein